MYVPAVAIAGAVTSSLNNFDFLKQHKLSAGTVNIGNSVDLSARQSTMKCA